MSDKLSSVRKHKLSNYRRIDYRQFLLFLDQNLTCQRSRRARISPYFFGVGWSRRSSLGAIQMKCQSSASFEEATEGLGVATQSAIVICV